MNKTIKSVKRGRPTTYSKHMKTRSLSFPPEQGNWITEQAKTRKISESAVVRALVDMAMGMQGAKI